MKKPAVIREMVVGYRTSPHFKPDKTTNSTFRCPEDIARFFRELKDWDVETFLAIYIDGRNNVKTWCQIAIGTADKAVPFVSTVLRNALLVNAASVAVVHNHPSGNTTPSAEDKRLTAALNTGCEAVEIKLIDHIIVASDDESEKFFSFAEAGAI